MHKVLQTVRDCGIDEVTSWYNEAKESLGDAVDAVSDWFKGKLKL